MKREPLLADRFLALDPVKDRSLAVLSPDSFWYAARDNLRLAKTFVLDTDATRYCAELLRKEPRIVADAQDFAIPPFDRTYIEFDFKTWYRVLTGRDGDQFADTKAGYLIVKNEVICLSGNDAGVGLSPLAYRLNEPFSVPEEMRMCEELGTSRITLDYFYWAESARTFVGDVGSGPQVMDEWQKEGLRSLRANHSFKIYTNKTVKLAKIWDKFYQGSAGDLRNIIGLLLFLNRTSKTRVERDVPMLPGRWIGRKQSTFLKHRVITFSVNPVPKLLRLAAGSGIQRRLHDVRGHLCHNEVARTNGCTHDWVEFEDNHLKWKCECGGLRWWKRPHMRGHEEKGIVTSEYRVTE